MLWKIKNEFENIQLKTLYEEALKRKNQESNEKAIKAFEQRIRRAINQALTNLASHGLADFSNPNFELYSSKFLDFAEVRLKMNELDGKDNRNPRINIRKISCMHF
ncbi:DNA-binding domain-containing protein [Anaerobacillus sp. HL2]|nr:DNA-binding domain-containing protein [Anaerobacillus sp. HL2]